MLAKVPTAPEMAQVAELGIGEGKLEAEGGRLRMDAVRAADGGRVLIFERALLQRREQPVEIGEQNVGGARELHGEAGVENVGRGEAEMDVARLRPDNFGEMRQKRDDIVLDLALDRVDAGSVKRRLLSFFPNYFSSRFRDQPKLCHGVGGVSLDLEPDAEAGCRRPDGGHVRPGVARDHAASPRAVAAALRMAAMLAR